MSLPPREYLAEIGSKGGKVKGKAKRRGDSDYYREIVKKRWAKRKAQRKGDQRYPTDSGT